ncbi:MAG: hypothetical protein K1X74_20345 [Pirellulales bacterium]|nr:hypothetical protein [Pirellulales bacterium]
MFRSMISLIRRVLLASLLSACATLAYADSPSNPDAPANEQPTAQAQTLEQLLDAGGFMYKKLDGGKYRVMVEGNGEVTAIVCYEGVAYTTNDGVEVKIIYMYRWLADLAEGTEPSMALVKYVNNWNDKAYVGSVIINQYGVYNSNFLWLSSCTAQNFADNLYFLHYDGLKLAKEIKGLLEETSQEAANAR